MKRTALALTLIIALLFSSVAGTQFINFGLADPFIIREFPLTVTILSPKDGSTFTDNHFLLDCTVTDIPREKFEPDLSSVTFYVRVILDGDLTPYPVEYNLSNPPGFRHSINVTNIPDGEHGLQVTAGYALETSFHNWTIMEGSSELMHLTIKTSSPPIITVLSIENKTYYTSRIPLNLTVSEPVTQITYSIDGNDNFTIAGNKTLTGLSHGEHNLTIYAIDLAGNTGSSEIIFFSIAEPELFPIILFMATVATVATVITGSLVHFKKRKQM